MQKNRYLLKDRRTLFVVFNHFNLPLTLGAWDFSSAVSSFCQIFTVTRAKNGDGKNCTAPWQRFFPRPRRLWLRPMAEDVSVGLRPTHRPHARTTSGTQGTYLWAGRDYISWRACVLRLCKLLSTLKIQFFLSRDFPCHVLHVGTKIYGDVLQANWVWIRDILIEFTEHFF